MAFHITSSRNYAVQYFDFRIPSNCNSLSEALHKGKSLYAWFGLTKHASFLANSDISRGLRTPFVAQRASLCSEYESDGPPLSVSLGIDSFRQAAQLSWRVAHTRSGGMTGYWGLNEGCRETPLPNHLEGGTPTRLGVVTQPRAPQSSPSADLRRCVGTKGEEGKGGHHSVIFKCKR